MIIKDFSEEKNNGHSLHERAEARKQKYVEFVLKGMTYQEILDTLKVSRSTMTKYALESNMVPSLSKSKEDFDRNLMYHCIKEHDEVQEMKNKIRQQKNEEYLERQKFKFDPDWFVK